MEDYQHYLIDCKYFENLNKKILDIFKELQIEKNLLTLKNYIFGYKCSNKQYDDINMFLTMVIFTIYKTYHTSDKKLKRINPIPILRIEVDKHIQYLQHKNYKIPKIFSKAQNILTTQ